MPDTMTIGKGTAVLYYPDGNRDAEPQHAVVAIGPVDIGGVPHMRITPAWRHVPVAHLDPHPHASALAGLAAPDGGELDFPPPDCPHCLVPCEYDDGFFCPECDTSWRTNGSDGRRRCVECDNDAAVVGDDSQPRCRPCQLEILAGNLDPTGAYQCSRCRREVLGLGCGQSARMVRLCPLCHHQEELHRSTAELLAEIEAKRSTGQQCPVAGQPPEMAEADRG